MLKNPQNSRHLVSGCFTLSPYFYYPVRTYTWFSQKPCHTYTIFLDLFCCLVKVLEFAANSTPEAQMGIKSILSPSIWFHIMFSTIFKLYNLPSCMTCLFPLGDYLIYTQIPNSSVHTPVCKAWSCNREELYALTSFCLLSAPGDLPESCFIRLSSKTSH